jgi:hypothetical protein
MAVWPESGGVTMPAHSGCYRRVNRLEDWVRSGDVTDALAAEAPELVSDLQSFPVVTPDHADDSSPSATVADTLPLPPKVFDIFRKFHNCYPLWCNCHYPNRRAIKQG